MITKKQLAKIGHGGFKSLVQKAIELGVDVYIYPTCTVLTRFTYNEKTVYAKDAYPPLPTQLGRFTFNKEATKIILHEHGISVPNGITAATATEAISLIKENELSYPLILKPIDGSLSKGITWDITSLQQLRDAVKYLDNERKKYTFLKQFKFIVEEMVFGDEYRVLVLNNKVISCVKRLPAIITGDGKLSITELIVKQNKSRPAEHSIKFDNVTKKHIKKNNLTPHSILPKYFKLALRNDVMLSNGGRAIDCTQQINHIIKKQCVKVIKSLGLTYGGIDIISKDITENKNYSILEVNSKPVYTINEKPLVEGPGVDVSLLLLQEIFPNLKKK